MRVRTSADSIRNMERLLAFDEAAGSKSIWPGDDSGTRTPGNYEQTGTPLRTTRTVSNRCSPLPPGKNLGGSAMVDHF